MDDSYIQLHDSIYKLMTQFAEIYNHVKENSDWKNPFRDVISKDIPNLLKECAKIDSPYSVVGSYGKGRWTAVPWIAVFDTRITSSAQKGIYIVYLLNKDTRELFLTFEIAATEVLRPTGEEGKAKPFVGIVGKIGNQLTGTLQERANTIRKAMGDTYFSADNKISSGADGYDAGAIYYKKYTLDNLPDGQILVDDLQRMMDIYKRYYAWVNNTKDKDDEWWPSLAEYNPGIDKVKWLELLNDGVTFTENAYKAMAAMFDFGGIATCRQLELKYGETSDFYRASLGVQLASKIKTKLELPYCKNKDGREQVWPVLFQGRDAHKDEDGSYVWKMRPELYEALKEFKILRYLKKKEGGNVQPKTVKESIEEVKAYVSSKGFNCDNDLIENFYISLRTKPFVILAGISGTGKSWITRLFAEAIGAGENYEMISVRPDWSDASELLGYVNLDGNFIPGTLTTILKKAAEPENRNQIFIVCLDEMNLARVEYYFSDFLSVIETRTFTENGIETKKIFKENSFGPDIDGVYKEVYGELTIPENVYIVGTVNMDETTHPFSKKVLDRANTIELSEVNLRAGMDADDEQTGNPVAQISVDNEFMLSKYLNFKECYKKHPEDMTHMIDILENINKALQPINAQIAYRVRNEIAYYLSYAIEENLLTFDQAMDNALMQKILPRIQGEGHRIQKAFGGIMDAIIPGKNFAKEEDLLKALENYQKTTRDDAPYNKTTRKICFMLEGIRTNGYATYWL